MRYEPLAARKYLKVTDKGQEPEIGMGFENIRTNP